MPLAVDYRFVLLAKIGAILYPHYRFKWPQMDWIHDEDFNAYLSRFDELNSWNSERRWLVWQLIRLTEDVEGDTAECGAFEGADSYLICKANRGRRQHHIFDSFEGLSRPDGADGTYWQEGGLARSEEIVARNLAEFSAYTFYRGWIPSRFEEVASRRFSFVHIDVDLHQPTLDSLAFFYPRMNKGGIIVCDDYG
ncbi:MAG TPA: macrocin O-methyltransferase, partial [Afipia sp.]|nr:macrocin O-methyltransferase [Afipia sp.]